jgi:hypothetical protein
MYETDYAARITACVDEVVTHFCFTDLEKTGELLSERTIPV